MCVEDSRMRLLNDFVSCGQEISGIVSRYMDFMRLRGMILNETERGPIENICDGLMVFF